MFQSWRLDALFVRDSAFFTGRSAGDPFDISFYYYYYILFTCRTSESWHGRGGVDVFCP